MSEQDTRITVRLPSALQERIEKLEKRSKMNTSEIVRYLVEYGLQTLDLVTGFLD